MQKYFHWLARFSLRGKVRISSAAKLQTPTSLCLSTTIKRNNVGVSGPSALLNTPNNLSWQQTPCRRSHTSIGCVHIHVLLESSSEIVKRNFPHVFPSYGLVSLHGDFWVGKLNSLPKKSEQWSHSKFTANALQALGGNRRIQTNNLPLKQLWAWVVGKFDMRGLDLFWSKNSKMPIMKWLHYLILQFPDMLLLLHIVH